MITSVPKHELRGCAFGVRLSGSDLRDDVRGREVVGDDATRFREQCERAHAYTSLYSALFCACHSSVRAAAATRSPKIRRAFSSARLIFHMGVLSRFFGT